MRSTSDQCNSYIPSWGTVVLHNGVIARHHCAIPHPREGYNYYITCYLGNITAQERDIWTTFLDVAWVKVIYIANQRIKIEIKGEVYSARVETDSEN